MEHDEKVQRAAHADAQRNIATAMARYGYQPPKRSAPMAMASVSRPASPTPQPVAPPPVTAAALAAAAEKAELRRLTAELVAKVEVNDEARAGWKKLATAHNGSAATAPEPDRPDPYGWRALAAKVNAERIVTSQDGVSADTKAGRNHGWGRFLPDRV